MIIHQHFAFFAIEGKTEDFARTETQKTRFLIFRIRINLATMSQLKEQAVFASHQRIVARLHSFKTLIGIKYGLLSIRTLRAI